MRRSRSLLPTKATLAIRRHVPKNRGLDHLLWTSVVRQFEQMDVFCANSSANISSSRDKLRSLQILSKHRTGIP